MNKTIPLLLLLISYCGCSPNSTTEKYQRKRDNIIDVRDKIKEIGIEDVLINRYPRLFIIEHYLFITDSRSIDEMIHIFDKDDFTYITSIAMKGQGPGEIANLGHIAEDKLNRKFYVSDHGKNKIFSYDLDSVITDPAYIPIEKMKMSEQLFPDKYIYINDTLSIGVIIEPTGNYGFNPAMGKLNMKTGEINLMKYTTNPQVKVKRISFDMSFEHGIYVECYAPHDLMTLCDLEGELKYNIYGPDWDTETHSTNHYGGVEFCNNRIVALYSGEKRFTSEGKSTLPTKFLIFDLEGNYLRTLETGYQIARFCFDNENNRFIMSMDDEIQFAYLDLEDLLD